MNHNAVNHRPDPSQPATFQRRVLLAVSGLAPQILTETLYALAADEHAPFVPTEVHLITSAEGARRAELSLLSDELEYQAITGVLADTDHTTQASPTRASCTGLTGRATPAASSRM